MKRILYDMGLLALVRCLLQRAFKFEPPFGPESELKRVPPPKSLNHQDFCKAPGLKNAEVYIPQICGEGGGGKKPVLLEVAGEENLYLWTFCHIFTQKWVNFIFLEKL